MNILDVISTKLQQELDIEPLKEGEVAVFKLNNAGRLDPSSTKKVSTPAFYGLAPKDTITDKYGLRGATEVSIGNIVGYDPITEPGKTTVMNPIFDYVRFPSNGQITVTSAENNLYLFLKLHNKNGSNPNRKKSKPVVFYEINEAKEVALQGNLFEYRTMASVILMDADDDKLVEMAVKISRLYPMAHKLDLTADSKALRIAVAHVAEKEPLHFILAVKEPKSYTRVIVDDSVTRRIMFFDDHDETLTWKWKRSAGAKSRKNIFKVDNARNAVKQLVDYLQTGEGNEILLELKDSFDQYYSTPR